MATRAEYLPGELHPGSNIAIFLSLDLPGVRGRRGVCDKWNTRIMQVNADLLLALSLFDRPRRSSESD